MIYKKLVSVCLSLLLLVMPVTCMASTMQLSQQDSQRLEQIFNELSNNNKILLQSSTQSALDLIAAQKELKELKQESQDLKELLVRLQAESIKTEQQLTSINDSLKKANQSLEKEQKVLNEKMSSLRRDRTMWEIIGAGLFGGLVYMSAKGGK